MFVGNEIMKKRKIYLKFEEYEIMKKRKTLLKFGLDELELNIRVNAKEGGHFSSSFEYYAWCYSG